MGSPAVPKYSFVILVVQAVIAAACIVLLILDEYLLWARMSSLLLLLGTIQLYRFRRARHQLDREYIQIRQAVVKHRNRELTPHEPQHTIDDALKGLREDIERHKNEV